MQQPELNISPILKKPDTALFSENAIITSFVATRRKYLAVKRAIDLLISLLCIVGLLSWLIPLVGILIKLDSPGPVFFKQKRVGLKGRIFHCLKFRTMVVNPDADERPAVLNDSRITKVGRILRRFHLDELPQMFNVFMGTMSIIGPRPHMISDCVRFGFVITTYDFRSLVKPGITGLAQVNGFSGPANDYESIMNRYYWDAEYVRRAGILLDMRIIARTFTNMFYKKG